MSEIVLGKVGRRMVRTEPLVPTARDYVQSGLIAMWDGIENAGWGTHDDEATVWKDLVGNADLTPVGGLAWGDNSPVFGGSLYFNAASGLSMDGGDMTAECVAMSTGALTNQGFIGFSNGNGRFLWLFAGNSLGSSSATLTWQYKGGAAVRAHYNQGALTGTFATSCVCENGICNAYKFGVRETLTKDAPVGSVVMGVPNNVGYINGFSRLTGKINNIRIYSRALTADEIAANYVIDKARFNLP